mmetsp:Transcript_18574/g.26058  ORF Transcript_18574/g.26058 Transcript_18574/m.26058 type:complete len:161 (+) Transcript_18574:33-515(+)|eukprot:CAMPEP_0175104258 /NCGR_PEP_ID=MMETSP0086_2-20121207/9611_1 /TAXON_ID=136419 /ORGANISM="Unknown Unknown, Strain D1" /LENGTH=160 /DNA_ID=CAMNT_0016379597 /DNA_START=30 /DNA_END=512 /DNA_ORIENTATION=+
MSDDYDFKQPAAAETSTLFFGVALLVASLPGYLFNGVHDMSLADFGVVILPITVLGALALIAGYKHVSDGTFNRLTVIRNQTKINHKKLNMTAAEANAVQTQRTQQESVMWSLFLNNAMFVTCFSFFAFYALQAVAAPYRYTIAMAASAAFVWQGSQFMG